MQKNNEIDVIVIQFVSKIILNFSFSHLNNILFLSLFV